MIRSPKLALALTLGLVVILPLLTPPLAAQQIAARMAEGVVLELADGRIAIVSPLDGEMKVTALLGEIRENSTKLDILAQDVVESIGGHQVWDIASTSAQVDSVAVGATMTVTLRRGAASHTIRYLRPEAPRGQMMIVESAGGGAAAGAGGWIMEGGAAANEEEVVVAGFHFRESREGGVAVSFRESDPNAAAVPLKTGDVVTSINGAAVTDMATFRAAWQKVPAAGAVTMSVVRQGATSILRFSKP